MSGAEGVWPDTVNDDHRQQLIDSGITPTMAVARGYQSVRAFSAGQSDRKHLVGDDKLLKGFGFSRRQRMRCIASPGLLIPMRDKRGEVWGHQLRPDSPYDADGGFEVPKYETPVGTHLHLDVPPGCGPWLDDPGRPLWLTEGTKKADCAHWHFDLCVAALVGVYGFRARNDLGGLTALVDWDEVALNGRDVIAAFDNDVTRNLNVRKALMRLAELMAWRKAKFYVCWLPESDTKIGLDDFVVAGNTADDLQKLIEPYQPKHRFWTGNPTDTGVHGGFPLPPDSAATPQHSWSGPPPTAAVLRNILEEIGTEVRARGLVGEEIMAQTVYLAMTSRLLDKPVSIGVKGHSASGKSYTVDTVTKFFPPEAFLEFTAMSERALVYSPEQYAHRTIVIYEVTAMRENVEDDLTSYLIRSLLSEGRIVYDVTTKDRHGNFTTRRVVKEGPTNLIFTTTKTRVHAENETRVLSLATNDSTEQTANVLKAIATEHTSNSLDDWIDLQRWLASDAAEHRVVIPDAAELARLIPPVAVRLRRDFSCLLSLIAAHAMLHQLNRARDADSRIIATAEDYAVVRDLVADVMTEGVGGTVSNTVRETVDAVVSVKQTMLEGASVRAVAKRLKIDKSNAGRRLKVAADGGYIQNAETRRGLPARWMVGDPLPDEVTLLPDATQLRTTFAGGVAPVDLQCCGVAPKSEGEGKTPGEGETPRPPDPSADGHRSKTENTAVDDRIKGLLTRRLQKVHHATRSQLKQALQAKDRPEFDAAFERLLAQQHLVADEGDARMYRLTEDIPDATGAGRPIERRTRP